MQIHHKLPLTDIVYYRIGGIADLVLEVRNSNDLIEALRYFQEHKIADFEILGFGANVILPDEHIPAVLWIHNGEEQINLIDEEKIKAYAGETLDSIIKFSFSSNLTGLGWAGGLPSSIGGAVRGNAGCFGTEMKDIVDRVEVIDKTDQQLEVKTLSNADCAFAYRESKMKHNKNLIIVSVTLKLHSATTEELNKDEEIYHKNIAYRESHHPMEYPSCGSVFKNIAKKEDIEKIISVWPDIKEMSEKKWYGKISMAYVIGKLGFAGLQIGGAQVSEKHNNYISNIDHATAEDVEAIIKQISDKFEKTFGFRPEPEVQIV